MISSRGQNPPAKSIVASQDSGLVCDSVAAGSEPWRSGRTDLQGDLNVDSVVDALNLVIMATHLVLDIPEATPPFIAPLARLPRSAAGFNGTTQQKADMETNETKGQAGTGLRSDDRHVADRIFGVRTRSPEVRTLPKTGGCDPQVQT